MLESVCSLLKGTSLGLSVYIVSNRLAYNSGEITAMCIVVGAFYALACLIQFRIEEGACD